jgi:hypothetical protein
MHKGEASDRLRDKHQMGVSPVVGVCITENELDKGLLKAQSKRRDE